MFMNNLFNIEINLWYFSSLDLFFNVCGKGGGGHGIGVNTCRTSYFFSCLAYASFSIIIICLLIIKLIFIFGNFSSLIITSLTSFSTTMEICGSIVILPLLVLINNQCYHFLDFRQCFLEMYPFDVDSLRVKSNKTTIQTAWCL